MATPRTGNPRGRPPGAKNKSKDLDAFILEALNYEIAVVVPKPIRKPQNKGTWAKLHTPEERTAFAKTLAAASAARGRAVQPSRAGIPMGRSTKHHQKILAAQRPEVDRIIKKMAKDGTLPEDPMAVEALKSAMMILRTAETHKDKLAASRLVLDFTKAKPTAKIEHTIRSAEDLLDEMIAGDE